MTEPTQSEVYNVNPKTPEEAIALNRRYQKDLKLEKTYPGTTKIGVARNQLKREKAAAAAAAKNPGSKIKNTGAGSKKTPPKEPDKEYKWNLPPHAWSLPVRPQVVQEEMYTGLDRLQQSSSPVFRNSSGLVVPETYRRGRLWWYFNTKTDYATSDGNYKQQATGAERKYGFQFLWNPESYTTSVQLNTEVTPHPSDRFAGVAGVFPSGETISFTLRLDRTNDFYCFRSLLKKDYSASLAQFNANSSNLSPFPNNPDSKDIFQEMADYYRSSFFTDTEKSLGKRIKDLMELGTIADLEYLFVAVNGPGWKNIIGRPTGDIGFLSATLLRVDIGPSSYVGYINSLTVNHIAFSQDMTPIRTDVQISMNLMASAGLADEGTAAAIAPKGKSTASSSRGSKSKGALNRAAGGGGSSQAVL